MRDNEKGTCLFLCVLITGDRNIFMVSVNGITVLPVNRQVNVTEHRKSFRIFQNEKFEIIILVILLFSAITKEHCCRLRQLLNRKFTWFAV